MSRDPGVDCFLAEQPAIFRADCIACLLGDTAAKQTASKTARAARRLKAERTRELEQRILLFENWSNWPVLAGSLRRPMAGGCFALICDSRLALFCPRVTGPARRRRRTTPCDSRKVGPVRMKHNRHIRGVALGLDLALD